MKNELESEERAYSSNICEECVQYKSPIGNSTYVYLQNNVCQGTYVRNKVRWDVCSNPWQNKFQFRRINMIQMISFINSVQKVSVAWNDLCAFVKNSSSKCYLKLNIIQKIYINY